MTQQSLILSFPDQSKSFAYGVEYGRILQQMEDQKESVDNHGFPVRLENKTLIAETCKEYGYVPSFGEEWHGYVWFCGVKKKISDN